MTSVAPVYTLTANLLAERTLQFAAWRPGRTQRATGESFQVGGKGINVSKMLTRLGISNTALCFTGGAAGAECEAWLRDRRFDFRAFDTGRPTRSGTVVRDASGTQTETTFLAPDVVPSASAVARCAEFLDAVPDGHVLALCGSVPGWATAELAPLRDVLTRWSRRGRLVVDTYGPPLADLVRLPVALLKINADELRSLPGGRIETLPSDVHAAVITDGPRTVWVRDAHGKTTSLQPPAVEEVSPTGSGDVFLACLIEAYFVRQQDLAEAAAYALPFAAANAAHPGVAEFEFPRR